MLRQRNLSKRCRAQGLHPKETLISYHDESCVTGVHTLWSNEELRSGTFYDTKNLQGTRNITAEDSCCWGWPTVTFCEEWSRTSRSQLWKIFRNDAWYVSCKVLSTITCLSSNVREWNEERRRQEQSSTRSLRNSNQPLSTHGGARASPRKRVDRN